MTQKSPAQLAAEEAYKKFYTMAWNKQITHAEISVDFFVAGVKYAVEHAEEYQESCLAVLTATSKHFHSDYLRGQVSVVEDLKKLLGDENV